MRMAGGTAIVIGGAQGSGRALSRALTGAGARVIVTDPDAGVAATFAQGIGQQGLACDPGDGAALARLAGEAGDADLVLLALDGSGGDAALLARSVAATVAGAVAHLAPVLEARGGGALLCVLTLSPAPDPWQEAAAGWLGAATVALSARLAARRVRVNAVVALADDAPPLPRFMAARAAAPAPQVPLAALPGPRAIAAAALSLCGEDAAAVTGQVLRLDGGRGAATA